MAGEGESFRHSRCRPPFGVHLLLRRSGVLPFGRVTPQRELVPCLPCCTLCLVTHAFFPPSRVRQLSGCFGSPRGTQARRTGAGCELVVQAQVPKWSEHRASLPLGPCISGLVHAYALAITLAASPEPPATGVRLTAFAQSDSCGRGDTQTLPVITTLPQLADASGGPRCASVRVSGGGSSSSTHSEAMLSHRPTSWPHTQGVHFTCSSNHMPCPSGRVRRHEIGASGLTTSHGGARVGVRWEPPTRTRRNNKHPTHTGTDGAAATDGESGPSLSKFTVCPFSQLELGRTVFLGFGTARNRQVSQRLSSRQPTCGQAPCSTQTSST